VSPAGVVLHTVPKSIGCFENDQNHFRTQQRHAVLHCRQHATGGRWPAILNSRELTRSYLTKCDFPTVSKRDVRPKLAALWAVRIL
jgi:hypothetical protein